MTRSRKLLVPENVSELMDHLEWMMLELPTFPGNKWDAFALPRNLPETMLELREGLGNIRKKLGQQRYEAALLMADRMQTLFEADPEDCKGDARQARGLILDIENLIKDAVRRKPAASNQDKSGTTG